MLLVDTAKRVLPAHIRARVRERILGEKPTPAHIRDRWLDLDAAGTESIRTSLATHYHVGWRGRDSYTDAAYAADVNAHLHGRLRTDREVVVPWLDRCRPLRGLRILEIGCGTGCSTVALVEQGAMVHGIDLDEGALRVARHRLAAYGLEAPVEMLNATQIGERFAPAEFDMIMFYASLEHMTVSERLESLQSAWQLLGVGGLLGVVDTPNRLWYEDTHTSQLPFFDWLPNDLAFRYSRFSNRNNFGEMYRELTADAESHFLRRGRGVSFHELDLAIEPVSGLRVAGDLASFLESPPWLRRLSPGTPARAYKDVLMAACPNVHSAFFEPYLNFVLQKS